MAPKLRLIRDVSRDREGTGTAQEDQYRYPAHEEIWEVSCGPDRSEGEKPTLTSDRRRAS